jgi:hypothetical protein
VWSVIGHLNPIGGTTLSSSTDESRINPSQAESLSTLEEQFSTGTKEVVAEIGRLRKSLQNQRTSLRQNLQIIDQPAIPVEEAGNIVGGHKRNRDTAEGDEREPKKHKSDPYAPNLLYYIIRPSVVPSNVGFTANILQQR